MLTSAIKGFNQEWAAVTANRDQRENVTGWHLRTACGQDRNFPNEHWDDPHGAAIHAMESHRCSNAGK
jgi:hypothetical protein